MLLSRAFYLLDPGNGTFTTKQLRKYLHALGDGSLRGPGWSARVKDSPRRLVYLAPAAAAYYRANHEAITACVERATGIANGMDDGESVAASSRRARQPSPLKQQVKAALYESEAKAMALDEESRGRGS